MQLTGGSASESPPELAGMDLYLAMGIDMLTKQQQLAINQPASRGASLPLSIRRVKSLARYV